MPVRGPDHAFYIPDASDRPEAARAWASQGKRRTLVLGMLVVMAVLAGLVGWFVEALRAEISGAAGPGRVLLPALFGLPVAALAIWADRCLYKATRPVFALPGEIYDERQARLVRAATMRARWIAYAVLAVMTALGAADVALGAILGAALAGFALLLSGPQLVLAWTLDPADFSPDAEDENA